MKAKLKYYISQGGIKSSQFTTVNYLIIKFRNVLRQHSSMTIAAGQI